MGWPMVSSHPTPLSGWRRHRYSTLLLALLLPAVVLPALEYEGLRWKWTALVFFALILAVSRYTVQARRSEKVKLMTLGAIAFLSDGASRATDEPLLAALQAVSWALFYGLLVILLMRWVLSHSRITGEHIMAAVCVYVCLALAWVGLYGLLLIFRPDAISFPGVAGESSITYFSFVTLTTLGYGDIVPVHPLARSLAFIEAIVGPLFVAVLIARLVALQIIDAQRDRDDQSNSS